MLIASRSSSELTYHVTTTPRQWGVFCMCNQKRRDGQIKAEGGDSNERSDRPAFTDKSLSKAEPFALALEKWAGAEQF